MSQAMRTNEAMRKKLQSQPVPQHERQRVTMAFKPFIGLSEKNEELSITKQNDSVFFDTNSCSGIK